MGRGALIHRIMAGAVMASGLVAFVGCASSPGSVPRGPEVQSWLVPADPSASETATVFLGNPVDPGHAPVPGNDSERILFSHLYVGLSAIASDGSVVPMLAERISPRTDLLWEIRLRSDLRFSDGTSLRAVDVAKSWALAAQRDPGREVWRHFDTTLVRVQGLYDLLVRTPAPDVDLPRLLADPAFAVVSFVGDDLLPVGAGPLFFAGGHVRPGENLAEPNPYFAGESSVDPETWTQPRAEGDVEKILSSGEPYRPLPEKADGAGTDDEGARRAVSFRLDPNADLRDAAGSHVDALLARDEEVVRFLGAAGFEAVPLPYDRGYLLLLSGPAPAEIDLKEIADLTVTEDARPWTEIEIAEERTASAQVREVLILRGAGTGVGATADGPYPGGSSGTSTPGTFDQRPIASLAAFGFGDIERPGLEEAERIGTRLAAIWDASVVVRTDEEPHVRLRPGQAVVVPIDRSRGSAALSSLTVRWLDLEGEEQVTILSLLESRGQLLVSPELSGVQVDGFGVPRFERSGRRSSSPPTVP